MNERWTPRPRNAFVEISSAQFLAGNAMVLQIYACSRIKSTTNLGRIADCGQSAMYVYFFASFLQDHPEKNGRPKPIWAFAKHTHTRLPTGS